EGIRRGLHRLGAPAPRAGEGISFAKEARFPGESPRETLVQGNPRAANAPRRDRGARSRAALAARENARAGLLPPERRHTQGRPAAHRGDRRAALAKARALDGARGEKLGGYFFAAGAE